MAWTQGGVCVPDNLTSVSKEKCVGLTDSGYTVTVRGLGPTPDKQQQPRGLCDFVSRAPFWLRWPSFKKHRAARSPYYRRVSLDVLFFLFLFHSVKVDRQVGLPIQADRDTIY
jgi:hypothetical protein